jgi:hypothetical protein
MFDLTHAAQLTRIEAKLDLILQKEGTIIMNESDLQTDLDALDAEAKAIVASLTPLAS